MKDPNQILEETSPRSKPSASRRRTREAFGSSRGSKPSASRHIREAFGFSRRVAFFLLSLVVA